MYIIIFVLVAIVSFCTDFFGENDKKGRGILDLGAILVGIIMGFIDRK